MDDFHKNMVKTLLAGGGAGVVEALTCHPLDTVKTRMQLRKTTDPAKTRGLFETFKLISQREGFKGLYKGLPAVLAGMGPKVAVRFTAFETYKSLLRNPDGSIGSHAVFLAGLGAGITEAVSIVNPMEVLKIRLQAQKAPTVGSGIVAPPTLVGTTKTIVANEGVQALYTGVELTALRQGTNQAVNFSIYTAGKDFLSKRAFNGDAPPTYVTAMLGTVAGACGPICNAPIDTIKTRMQNTSAQEMGVSSFERVRKISTQLLRSGGIGAFYKGLTPRLIRVAPGQGVSFMTFELLKPMMDKMM